MKAILSNIDYIVSVILFTIGLYGLVFKHNVFKKLLALNILETSVYLFYIALGDVRLGKITTSWAKSPYVKDALAAWTGKEVMVNPIPTGLILTAIVVCVCITAFSLSLVVKLYQYFGTLDTRKITTLKG